MPESPCYQNILLIIRKNEAGSPAFMRGVRGKGRNDSNPT